MYSVNHPMFVIILVGQTIELKQAATPTMTEKKHLNFLKGTMWHWKSWALGLPVFFFWRIYLLYIVFEHDLYMLDSPSLLILHPFYSYKSREVSTSRLYSSSASTKQANKYYLIFRSIFFIRNLWFLCSSEVTVAALAVAQGEEAIRVTMIIIAASLSLVHHFLLILINRSYYCSIVITINNNFLIW